MEKVKGIVIKDNDFCARLVADDETGTFTKRNTRMQLKQQSAKDCVNKVFKYKVKRLNEK